MKIGPVTQFLIIGAVVGIIAPFIISICLFGTTLQSMVAGAVPTPGFLSGAATPMPTQVPNPVQVWTNDTFSAGGGAVFVLWSMLGAFAGEAIAVARWRNEMDATRRAWLAALAGSIIFMVIALCGFMR